MENIIITSEVMNNMPNSDILSSENDQYFADLYAEFINELAEL